MKAWVLFAVFMLIVAVVIFVAVMFWYVFFPAVAIVICLCMACAKLEKVCFKETRDFPKDYSDSV